MNVQNGIEWTNTWFKKWNDLIKYYRLKSNDFSVLQTYHEKKIGHGNNTLWFIKIQHSTISPKGLE